MPINAYDETLQQATGAPPNPHVETVQQQTADAETALRVAHKTALQTTPDRAAEVAKLVQRTGLPAGVVERNFDDIRTRATITETPYTQMQRESPALVEWMKDPAKLAVASDDLPQLTDIERVLQIGRRLVGAPVAGVFDFTQGLYGAVQAGAEASGSERLAEFAGLSAAAAGQLAARARGDYAGAGFLERSILGGVESVGQMGPALLAGLVAGPEVALALIGTTTGGQSYSQARQEGVGVGKAALFGSIQGAIEVGTEFLPAHRLLKDLDAHAGLIQTIVHQIKPELIGENVATILQDLNEWAVLPSNKEKTFIDYLKERPSAAAATTISTIVAIGATTVAGHSAARFVERLGQGVEASKTAQRMPEAVQDFVAQATKDTPVESLYAPVETWTTYWQSKGVDPAIAAADLTGDPQAYSRAVQTGEDLIIPTAAYAVKLAGTEHNAFFTNELRLAPEQMNGREADEFQKTQAETLAAEPPPPANGMVRMYHGGADAAGNGALFFSSDRAYAEAYAAKSGGEVSYVDLPVDHPLIAADYAEQSIAAGFHQNVELPADIASKRKKIESSRPVADASPVREDITQQLTAAGFAQSAPAYGALYEAAFQTLGDRAGIDPVELYTRYALRVREGDLTNVQEGITVAADASVESGDPGRGVEAAQRGNTLAGGDRSGAQGRRVSKRAEAEQHAIAALVESAVQSGYAGDPAELTAKLSTRASVVREINQEVDAAGGTAAALLRAVKKAGGLSRTQERGLGGDGLAGELTRLRESALAKSGVLRDAGGLPVDRMVEHLQQDPRFQHITSPNVLLDELESIASGEKADAGAIDAKQLGAAGDKWWELFQTGRLAQDRSHLSADDKLAAITFGPDRQFTITLTPHADLSSFLHETGHLFLEIMRDLGAQSPDVKADLDTLGDWFEQETGSREIDVAQHELFARGFEAYLFEGNAPSADLRSVFAKFRAWLVGVYRSLRDLNVTLTPEVRRVFDRLVASDDAIKAAEYEGHVLAVDLSTAGLTEGQFAKYRALVEDASLHAQGELAQRVLRELQRAQQAWWTDARAEVRDAVAADAYAAPIYRALAAIRKGTHPDGTPLFPGADPTPMKLGKAFLLDYDAATLAALRKQQLYTVDGGVQPDAIAELFGFSSGDELIKTLAATPPMEQAIDAETDARMTAKFGDILRDGALPEAAQAAVFGEHRQAVVQAELKALMKGMRQGVIPSSSVIRAVAEQRIGGTKVRDLRPGHFLMAAQRASAKAFDLVAEGVDRVAAVQAKQQELVNLALYREARDAQERAEAAKTFLRGFKTPASRARIGKAGGGFLDAIDTLLDRYELSTVTNTTLDRRASLRSFVASLEGQGLPVDLPEAVLDDARQINWRELTVDELTGVKEAVQQIAHLARLKNRLLKSEAKRTLEEEAGVLTASIAAHAKPSGPRKFEVRLPGDRAQRTVSTWFAAHRKQSSFLREMDGFQDGGPMVEAILWPQNAAANAETLRNGEENARLAALFDTAFAGREATLYRKQAIPAINTSLSTMGRIMVALNTGNEGNQQRLRGGFGWTDGQIQAVTDTLTEEDWRFVQDVWDYLDTFRPEIAAKETRVHGVEPEWVEARSVVTKFGTLRGGYFPIKYENQLSARVSANLEGSFADSIKQASYVKATTRRGHLEARAERVTEPLRLDFGVITEHVTQVVHDLTHHEMLIDVSRLLGHKAVQDAIYQHYGDVVYEQLKGAIRDVAWGVAPAPSWYRPLNSLRQGVVTASLGWNLVTSALQPFQVTNGMVRVGPSWVLKGYARWMRNAASMESTAGWIQDRSAFMRTRGDTQLREINELRNKIGLDRGRISGWLHDNLHRLGVDATHMPVIADSYFYIIQKGQQLADIPTWLGAYEKAMADETNDEDRAVALADQAVIDSQASGHIKDLAAVERQPLLKILTTFYSYNNLLLNQSIEVVKRTDFKKPAQMGRLGVDAALLLFAPSAISYFIHQAASGGDDKDNESLVKKLVKHQIADLFGLFVGTRELAGAIEGRPYEGPAGMRYVGTVVNAGNQIAQREVDPAFWRSLNQTGGIFFHYPATQVQRTAEGFNALMEGKTRNPTVLLTGPGKAGR